MAKVRHDLTCLLAECLSMKLPSSHLSLLSPTIIFFAFGVFVAESHAQWDAPAGYYSSATGTGSVLKNQLTTIMSNGHIQRTYGEFRFSAAIHDQNPNNSSRILTVYDRSSVNQNCDSGTGSLRVDQSTAEFCIQHRPDVLDHRPVVNFAIA